MIPELPVPCRPVFTLLTSVQDVPSHISTAVGCVLGYTLPLAKKAAVCVPPPPPASLAVFRSFNSVQADPSHCSVKSIDVLGDCLYPAKTIPVVEGA